MVIHDILLGAFDINFFFFFSFLGFLRKEGYLGEVRLGGRKGGFL